MQEYTPYTRQLASADDAIAAEVEARFTSKWRRLLNQVVQRSGLELHVPIDSEYAAAQEFYRLVVSLDVAHHDDED